MRWLLGITLALAACGAEGRESTNQRQDELISSTNSKRDDPQKPKETCRECSGSRGGCRNVKYGWRDCVSSREPDGRGGMRDNCNATGACREPATPVR